MEPAGALESPEVGMLWVSFSFSFPPYILITSYTAEDGKLRNALPRVLYSQCTGCNLGSIKIWKAELKGRLLWVFFSPCLQGKSWRVRDSTAALRLPVPASWVSRDMSAAGGSFLIPAQAWIDQFSPYFYNWVKVDYPDKYPLSLLLKPAEVGGDETGLAQILTVSGIGRK